MSQKNKLYFSYRDFHSIIHNQLAQNIKQELNPHVIIAIGGGGLVPGRIFRTALKIPIYTVHVHLYPSDTDPCVPNSKPKITQWLDDIAINEIKGKRILLVDDIDDSRVTLDFCIRELQKSIPSIIKLGVAVIFNKNKTKTIPRLPDSIKYFYGMNLNEDAWLIFPWDVFDIDEHDKKVLDQNRLK